MNIDAKVLNKIFTNKIQQYLERRIYSNREAFILEMKGWFGFQKSIMVIHHVNILKKKHHMIPLIDGKKII